MANWGKPGPIAIYCLIGLLLGLYLIKEETKDKGLLKIIDTATTFKNNMTMSAGSAVTKKGHRRNKNKSHKKH
jgi:hypothetical protein